MNIIRQKHKNRYKTQHQQVKLVKKVEILLFLFVRGDALHIAQRDISKARASFAGFLSSSPPRLPTAEINSINHYSYIGRQKRVG